jgi:hypothetical protein
MLQKLLNATHTEKDPQFRIYAFKQIAFCQIKMKDFDLALRTLRKALQFAWVVSSYTAETQIYDMMSVCHFYKGDLKKSGYYNHRFIRGVSEATWSRVRKICVLQSPDLKRYLEAIPKDFSGLKSLFS